MSTSLLERIPAAAQDVLSLNFDGSKALVQFLVRWEAYGEAFACLEQLDLDLVTWQDERARALAGLGRSAEAVAAMQARVAQKDSTTARTLLAEICIQAGLADEAWRVIEPQLKDTYGPPWSRAGDVALLKGDLDAAEQRYLRHQQIAPSSREPAVGLTEVYRRRGDAVTATAYAVRAATVEEGQYAPTVAQLKRLRDFFTAMRDENHLADVQAELIRRFDEDLQLVRGLFAVGGAAAQGAQAAPARRAAAPGRAAPAPAEVAVPVVRIEDVRVTPQELKELKDAAKKLFNFTELLPAQAEIMALARRGEHVLAVLPTGAGKSLCYQLPAFLDGGLTLVVSPLIALMKDQVDGLPAAVRGRAIAIHSLQDGAAQRDAFDGIARGRYQLVYVAPERLRQLAFIHLLRSVGLRRLVIDEAHCVSVWGHDFRPDYLHIRRAHADLGAPPILGLTATAPPQVRTDIQRQLFGVGEGNRPAGDLRVVAADTYRPNLVFSALKVAGSDEKTARVPALCRQLEGPGIVYARSRAATEQIAELLSAQGVKAEAYHAGLPPQQRIEVQDRFMAGRTRVIVATIAFGMGIDKPDIRFIIHHGLSNSVEAYYQEAGRAGRDGKPSHCVLLYSAHDKAQLTAHANLDKISREFLREVYKAVKAALKGQTTGPVALQSLQLAVGENDDTKVRVALSTLEEAGLLERHYDAPVSANLALAQPARDPELNAFAQAARLAPGQWVDWNFAELAVATGLHPATLEWKLLGWRGPLTVNTAGRDLMLTLKPGDKDAGRRVDALIDRYATLQKQRVSDIYAYAQTRRCRNGYLAAYLGGQPRSRCTNCDNCGVRTIHDLPFTLPDDSAVEAAVLGALSEHSWGRLSLQRLLRGEAEMQERGGRSPFFGRLRDRSETAIKRNVEALIDAGAVEEVALDNGGIALRLTAAGRKRTPRAPQHNKP